MITWYDLGTAPKPDLDMPLKPVFLYREHRPQDYVSRITHMRKDDGMTINYPIADPTKPVEIWVRDGSGPAKAFPNMETFYRWYRPKVHIYMGARETPKDIVIFLDNATDPSPSSSPELATKKVKEPKITPRPGAGITVDGKPYRSVLAAFDVLKLPISKHQKFRAALKAAGALAFEHDGRSYSFKTGGV